MKYTVSVIAPSRSLRAKDEVVFQRAVNRLAAAGIAVKESPHIRTTGYLGAAPAHVRARDFVAAMQDQTTDAVLALDGGWQCNGMLPWIEWKLVRDCAKPVVGYSDITVLLNAISAKTAARSMYGPNVMTIGRDSDPGLAKGIYAALNGDLDNRKTVSSKVYRAGTAEGTLIGGNVGSFFPLQGTEYMPTLNSPAILAIEDDDEAGVYAIREFDRRVESIMQQPFSGLICGVMVGMMQTSSSITERQLRAVLKAKFPPDIPIAYNLAFGHERQSFVLPLRTGVRMSIRDGAVSLRMSDRTVKGVRSVV